MVLNSFDLCLSGNVFHLSLICWVWYSWVAVFLLAPWVYQPLSLLECIVSADKFADSLMKLSLYVMIPLFFDPLTILSLIWIFDSVAIMWFGEIFFGWTWLGTLELLTPGYPYFSSYIRNFELFLYKVYAPIFSSLSGHLTICMYIHLLDVVP